MMSDPTSNQPALAPEPAAMLAAHVQFELDRLYGPALFQTIQAETAALYARLGSITVGELVTPAQLTAWIQVLVLMRELPPEAARFVAENAQVILEYLQEDDTPLNRIVPKDLYDATVEQAAKTGTLRRRLTHAVIGSDLYARLVADVLYHGIKSFMLTDNALAKNIPGASSLVKLGQSALNAAAPQLEKGLDKQITAFISANIQASVGESEAFVNRTLDDDLVRSVGAELWQEHAGTTVAALASAVDRQNAGGAVDLAQQWWMALRQSPLATEIVQIVVRSFFLHYGKLDVRTVLERFGLGEAAVVQQAMLVAPLVTEHPVFQAWAEERLRERLGAFYDYWFAQHAV